MKRKSRTQKQICDSYLLWTFKRELSPSSFLLELSRRAQLFKTFITARFNYMQDRATAKRGLVQQHLKGSRPIDLILNYLKSFVAQFTNLHRRRILGWHFNVSAILELLFGVPNTCPLDSISLQSSLPSNFQQNEGTGLPQILKQ
ncbi:unnamed protein product [Sphagnum troendelagicum]